MFVTRLGGKFKEFPGLAKYVAMLKVSPAQGYVHQQFSTSWAKTSSTVGQTHRCSHMPSTRLRQNSINLVFTAKGA